MSDSRSRRAFSRRGFLTVGTMGFGLSLGDFFRMKAHAEQKSYAAIAAKADSVIHIFLPGGIAHQETFDPKPFAPVEYRGELSSIATKIEGESFCQTLPHTAQVADKLTVIRSMTHGEAAHERGTHNMFTGYRPSPALQYPSMGSVVAHEYGPKNNLPPYVCVPSQPNVYAGTGYLSSSFAPFSLGSDPADGGFRVQDLNLPGGIDDSRFATRRNVLDAVNDHFARKEKSDGLAAMDTFYQRAYSLISSQKAREAFNIHAEPAAIRDAYGRNAAGQRMLMARRLVAAGVRLVCLQYGGWDMHAGVAAGMRQQMPAFDQAFAALTSTTSTARACSTAPSSWSRVSSDARPRLTRTPAATTGPRCSASSWLAAASRRATSTARPTPRPPSPNAMRSGPRTSPRPCTTNSGSWPTKSSWPLGTARSRSSMVGRSVPVSLA